MAKPGKLGKPGKHGKHGKPGKPNTKGKQARPMKKGKPDKPRSINKQSKPFIPSKQVKPDKPDKRDKPEKSDEPRSTNTPQEKPDKQHTDRKAQREKKKFDFERNSRTIFVGNLPNTMDQKDLAKLFADCGPVESCRIRSIYPEKEKLAPKVALITNRMHPKVDSFNGYVVFKTNENDECVKKALLLNGKVVEKHHIRVDRAQRPLAKKMTLTSRKKSIFVGNLRFDIREDDLINHFGKVGSVNHVRIVRDRATGMGKGFAFVAFNERASVKKSLEEMNGTKYKGRELRIKKVEDENDKKGKKKGPKKENKTEDD